jgi:hypothetical protein
MILRSRFKKKAHCSDKTTIIEKQFEKIDFILKDNICSNKGL